AKFVPKRHSAELGEPAETCGSTANRMQDSQLAPVERTPSTGFMSAFSTISEKSLPSARVEWIAIASTPAIGPSPNAITKISANTMPGTVRANSRRGRTGKRSQGGGGG